MSAGPILIFDKSLIEMLSPDEAVWLGQFYRVNIVPVFLVETLADLEKEVAAGRTPEQVVGRLAEKTNIMTADPNTHHWRLALSNLLGAEVPMKRFVVRGDGRPVQQEGKDGWVFHPSEEDRALSRWKDGRFLEAEREFAKSWREGLKAIDLEAVYLQFKPLVDVVEKPRTAKEVKALVDGWLNEPAFAERMLGAALQMQAIPYEAWPDIFKRWATEGRPVLPTFAPYAAYVMSVDLFFAVGIAADVIGRGRPTHKVDMSYLYYLPFCMVFASMDKLHAWTVPVFLREDQEFVWGADLKADLKWLDTYFDSLPDDVKAQGVLKFANHLPDDDTCLTRRLCDKFLSPEWRRRGMPRRERTDEDREREKKLIAEIRAATRAPTAKSGNLDDAQFVVLEHRIPRRMGKWTMVPPDTPDADKDGW
jgi:hypothetical protein